MNQMLKTRNLKRRSMQYILLNEQLSNEKKLNKEARLDTDLRRYLKMLFKLFTMNHKIGLEFFPQTQGHGAKKCI